MPRPAGAQPSFTPTIVLSEFESVEAALSPEVYAALRVRYPTQLEVTPTVRPGLYRLAAGDYVGRVGLPGGGLLVIRPKVGVSSLFYMLCVDAGLAGFRPPPTGLHESAGIYGFVLAAFLSAVRRLLDGGLLRDYRQRDERLPFVRGRLLVGKQARAGGLAHVQPCRYAERALDTPENRVVAAALRYIPALTTPPERKLARTARAFAARFDGVEPLSRGAAISTLRSVEVHRLNAPYGPALGLAGLVLRHLTLDERAGAHPFASFLIDMPRLFERFVTARLAAMLPERGLRVVAQRHDYLDEERTVGIRPDILVYSRDARAGREAGPLLVLDTKYRRPGGAGGLNADLYQISAYLDRWRLSHGVLVYPIFGGDGRSRLRLRGTRKRLHLATVELDAPTPAALDESCARLAEMVAALALAQPGS